MSADDVAAVREALESPTLPRAFLLAEALAALDRIAARLQEAERERQKADEELADKVGVEKALLDAEAREAALREALEAAQPWLMVSSDTYPQHHETLVRVHAQVRAALAADGKQS